MDRQAALDFLLGHMNVLGAVIFGETDGVFSDACNKAIEFGKPGADARRLEARLRAAGDRREHPAHHLTEDRTVELQPANSSRRAI